MSLAWEILRELLVALAILWTAGSLAIAAFRPWRHVEPEDRWLAWALVFGWVIAGLWILAELGLEWRLDRRDARARRGR